MTIPATVFAGERPELIREFVSGEVDRGRVTGWATARYTHIAMTIPAGRIIEFEFSFIPNAPLLLPRSNFRIQTDDGEYTDFVGDPVSVTDPEGITAVNMEIIEITERGSIYDRRGADDCCWSSLHRL